MPEFYFKAHSQEIPNKHKHMCCVSSAQGTLKRINTHIHCMMIHKCGIGIGIGTGIRVTWEH